MNRFEPDICCGVSCVATMVQCEDGEYVRLSDAKAEIEKLKTERAAFIELLQMTVDAGGVLDISERGQIYEAIAKAKGEKA